MNLSQIEKRGRRAPQLTVIDLHRRIQTEEFDSILLKDVLRDYSHIKMKVQGLLKCGAIVRVKKGIYVFAPPYNRRPVSLEVLAGMIYGPSAISLEWALSHHGLIPERTHVVTCITPNRDKEFQTPLGEFTYRRLAMAKYVVGIEHIWLDDHHSVLMASPEKALCDKLLLSDRRLVFESADNVMPYLTEDLRIPAGRLKTLRRDLLHELATAYKKKSVVQMVEVLSR